MTTRSVRDCSVPLRTLDPSDPDVDDLAAVESAVGDARVVCLGESAHGVSEFTRFKDRVSRFLVRRLGFSAFVLESGFPEGLTVNDWVLGGEGDLDAIAAEGITYGFGQSAHMRDQLFWMRDRNLRGGGPVRFYGMDVPGSCANPVTAVRACLERLPAAGGDEELLRLADLGPRFQAATRHRAMPREDRARLSRGIAELVDRASVTGNDVARYCAIGAQRLDDQLNAGGYQRDEAMADTVRWILEHEDRVIISAHNGHVQRGTLPNGAMALGGLLAPLLGEQLVVLATTRSTGWMPDLRLEGDPPHSATVAVRQVGRPPSETIDALMDDSGVPPRFVDLREVSSRSLDGITAMSAQAGTFDLDPAAAFDGLIHIGQISCDDEFCEFLRESSNGV